jgi:hypothetical protein
MKVSYPSGMMVSYDSSEHNEQELSRSIGRTSKSFFSNFGHMASHDWAVMNNESGRILQGSVEA